MFYFFRQSMHVTSAYVLLFLALAKTGNTGICLSMNCIAIVTCLIIHCWVFETCCLTVLKDIKVLFFCVWTHVYLCTNVGFWKVGCCEMHCFCSSCLVCYTPDPLFESFLNSSLQIIILLRWCVYIGHATTSLDETLVKLSLFQGHNKRSDFIIHVCHSIIWNAMFQCNL